MERERPVLFQLVYNLLFWLQTVVGQLLANLLDSFPDLRNDGEGPPPDSFSEPSNGEEETPVTLNKETERTLKAAFRGEKKYPAGVVVVVRMSEPDLKIILFPSRNYKSLERNSFDYLSEEQIGILEKEETRFFCDVALRFALEQQAMKNRDGIIRGF